MDIYKVNNYEKENFGFSFPAYKELDSSKCKSIMDDIIMRYGFACQDSLGLVRIIDSSQNVVGGINAEDANFDLHQVFSLLKINPDTTLFINWYRYDKIDSIDLEDLVKYFKDIWYPSVDDIDIFDQSLNWILSVSHYGVVKILKNTV